MENQSYPKDIRPLHEERPPIPSASSVSVPKPPRAPKGKASRSKVLVGLGLSIMVVFLLLLMAAMASVGLVSGIGPLGGDSVVLIEIEGPIMASKPIMEQIDRFKENEGVLAFVLRIDSPGGGVVAAQDIHQELIALRQEYGKKVVVSFGNMGASGAYYIACAADKIVSGPGTMTGSIGVVMQMPVAQELLDKLGLRWEVVKGGEYKDAGSMFRGMEAEERALFQAMVDDVHEQFIEAVAEGRDLDMGFVREVAQGQIYTGRQAQELGLVDRLGNLTSAIDEAKKISGISGEPRIIHATRPKPALLDELLGTMASHVGLRQFACPIQYRSPLGP